MRQMPPATQVDAPRCCRERLRTARQRASIEHASFRASTGHARAPSAMACRRVHPPERFGESRDCSRSVEIGRESDLDSNGGRQGPGAQGVRATLPWPRGCDGGRSEQASLRGVTREGRDHRASGSPKGRRSCLPRVAASSPRSHPRDRRAACRRRRRRGLCHRRRGCCRTGLQGAGAIAALATRPPTAAAQGRELAWDQRHRSRSLMRALARDLARERRRDPSAPPWQRAERCYCRCRALRGLAASTAAQPQPAVGGHRGLRRRPMWQGRRARPSKALARPAPNCFGR